MRRLPSLIALRFFEETARHMSFNRAAVALCVTQGAVSRQIKILEESLGTRLFERDHKGIRLTGSGTQLLRRVSEAFDTLEHGTREVMSAKGRRLVLSVPPTFATQWFSPRLGSLAIELPAKAGAVRLDFNFTRNLQRPYTAFAPCPLAPAQNRLTVAIEAGDQLPVFTD